MDVLNFTFQNLLKRFVSDFDIHHTHTHTYNHVATAYGYVYINQYKIHHVINFMLEQR